MQQMTDGWIAQIRLTTSICTRSRSNSALGVAYTICSRLLLTWWDSESDFSAYLDPYKWATTSSVLAVLICIIISICCTHKRTLPSSSSSSSSFFSSSSSTITCCCCQLLLFLRVNAHSLRDHKLSHHFYFFIFRNALSASAAQLFTIYHCTLILGVTDQRLRSIPTCQRG